MTAAAPRIVLVAGEQSGDNLGARLIEAIRERVPNARFAGIAGPRMAAAGCEVWEPAESLAVFGLFEVLPHLRRLLRIRRELISRVLADPPDLYVGVDAKEFNLRVAAQLKSRGVRTAQYVSPQVWAWRQGRVRTIGAAVDLVLCLLPFEVPFYERHQVPAVFVGHPLADHIPLVPDQQAARAALDLPLDRPILALLPGSRRSEVSSLSADFARTVRWLHERRSDLVFVAAIANANAHAVFSAALVDHGVADHVRLIDGRSTDVLTASDAVLLASGTATLEAMLCKRPMVVAYRLQALTSFLLQRLRIFKAPFFAQPNLLAGRKVVPEFLNADVRADVLGPAVLEQFERADRADVVRTFTAIHAELRRDASARAAEAVIRLLAQGECTGRP